jgi:hypothetical protein
MAHFPAEQVTLATLGRELAAGQAAPQPPQLETSVSGLTQVPLPQGRQHWPAVEHT